MRLASYNVENMFMRAVVLNQTHAHDVAPTLELHVKLNTILQKPHYSPADKTAIHDMLEELGLLADDNGGRFAVLRQNHGKLLIRHKNHTVDVVAGGRGDWIGWVDLKTEEVNEQATLMTAKVIDTVAADVVALVEVESRPAILRFAKNLVNPSGEGGYQHMMLIDGNDERGIDVGIMTKRGYELTSMVSHVDDADADGLIFSRDCPVYFVSTPKGNRLAIVPNHLKSKGFGSQGDNDKRRLRQATRVRAIYEALLDAGQDFVAVVGDFNDVLDAEPLAPLTAAGLRDISGFANFEAGVRPGTFQNCTASQKIDHILLSPKLGKLVQGGGIERRGVWGGKNGDLFPHFDEIGREIEAASDHAAIFADIDV
jgi:endonuclease/exonuclease/phosphatase family metal-dependent hydrolase